MLSSRKAREYGGWLLLLLVSLLFFAQSFQYGLGTMQRVMPGAFPMLASGALGAISLLMLLHTALSADDGERAPLDLQLRPLLAVMAGLIAFAASIRTLGLVPAICLAMLIAGLGHRESRFGQLALVAVAMAGACWLLFGVLLRLPLRPFTFWG